MTCQKLYEILRKLDFFFDDNLTKKSTIKIDRNKNARKSCGKKTTILSNKFYHFSFSLFFL